MRGFDQSIAMARPEMHIEVRSEYHFPGCSIREVVITGTHEGDFAGVRPLGNRVSIEMAALGAFDAASGKLVSERIFYHQAGMPAQVQAKQTSAVS